MVILGLKRVSTRFPDPVGSNVDEYGPERCRGDPTYTQNYIPVGNLSIVLGYGFS